MRTARDTFRLTYDSDSDGVHDMDAADVAAALLGVSSLVTLVHQQANNDGAQLDVRIRPFKEGSFEVVIDVLHRLPEAAVILLTAGGPTAIANVFSLLGINGVPGVLQLFKALGKKGRVIETKALEGGREAVTIETPSGRVEVVATKGAAVLVETRDAKVAIGRMVQPLRDQEADWLDVRGTSAVRITAAEIEAAAVSVGDEYVSVARRALQVVRVVFPKDDDVPKELSWRVTDLGRAVTVRIVDQEFIKQVAGGARFGKNDILDADIEVTQVLVDGVLKPTSRRVLKVYAVTALPSQPRLTE